jgi:hypothetical protein
MRTKTLFILSLLCLAALAVTACGVIPARASSGETPVESAPQTGVEQAAAGSPRTLSVSGNGQVTMVPDIAYVTLGVKTDAADAKTAVESNNVQTESLADALLTFGIEAKDIQTTNFSIYSWDDYNKPLNDNGTPAKTYTVENSVFVTVRDISRMGELLATAVDSGANNIWGIQFDVADKSQALSDARERAVANAAAQAQELAGLAGVELGEIVSISSYGGGYPTPYGYGFGGGGAAEAASVSNVPVSPGLLVITIDVSVVYEIK